MERIVGFFLSLVISAVAEAELTREDKLKAAYLFNFTKYLEWPEGVVKKGEISICLVASRDFSIFMKDLVKGRSVGEYALPVKIYGPEVRDDCHIMYLDNSESILPKNSMQGLVVGADSSVAIENRTVYFYTEKGKVRFYIDVDRARVLGVKISSELLKLSKKKSK